MERLSSRLFNKIQFLYKDAEVALFSPYIIFAVMAAGRNNLLPWLRSGNFTYSAALLFNKDNLFAY